MYTDTDFHAGMIRDRGYKILVLSTHPEYWTRAMFNNLTTYLDEGGSLLYLGGNGIYEEGTYVEGGTAMEFGGGTDRESDDDFNRRLFRVIDSPERALLGIATEACGVQGAPYAAVPEQSGHEILRGISASRLVEFGRRGLNTGCNQCNGAASAWEVDTRHAGGSAIPTDCRVSPMPVPLGGDPPVEPTLLAVATNRQSVGAEMVYFDRPGGGFVFSVGSITFGGSLVVDYTLSQIVANAMALAEERARRR